MSIDLKTLQNRKYVDVHRHDDKSILDGVGNIRDHVCESCAKGHQGTAITNHGNMGSVLELYHLSRDSGFLKQLGRSEKWPVILGAELYITYDITVRDQDYKYSHITIYAYNRTGYKNLTKLTTMASHESHFYVRPRISLDELLEHSEGLIVTSGCFLGLIPQAITRNTGQEEILFRKFKDHFGDNFFVEIHLSDISLKWDGTQGMHIDQGFNPQEKVNIRLYELAKKYYVKTVIAQDSHMPKKEHWDIQTMMMAQASGNKPGKASFHFPEAYYTMSVVEMYEKKQKCSPYITDHQFMEGIDNSMLILDKCKDLELRFSPSLPEIQYAQHPVNAIPSLESKLLFLEEQFKAIDLEFAFLLTLSRSDIALRTALKVIIQNKKVDVTNQVYRKRLTYELKTIQRNGIIQLVDYFMLLEDVTRYVRDNGYLRGFGRGSAAGCLVAYALDITDVDPIKWGLLFERFLTPERIGKMDFSIPGRK